MRNIMSKIRKKLSLFMVVAMVAGNAIPTTIFAEENYSLSKTNIGGIYEQLWVNGQAAYCLDADIENSLMHPNYSTSSALSLTDGEKFVLNNSYPVLSLSQIETLWNITGLTMSDVNDATQLALYYHNGRNFIQQVVIDGLSTAGRAFYDKLTDTGYMSKEGYAVSSSRFNFSLDTLTTANNNISSTETTYGPIKIMSGLDEELAKRIKVTTNVDMSLIDVDKNMYITDDENTKYIPIEKDGFMIIENLPIDTNLIIHYNPSAGGVNFTFSSLMPTLSNIICIVNNDNDAESNIYYQPLVLTDVDDSTSVGLEPVIIEKPVVDPNTEYTGVLLSKRFINEDGDSSDMDFMFSLYEVLPNNEYKIIKKDFTLKSEIMTYEEEAGSVPPVFMFDKAVDLYTEYIKPYADSKVNNCNLETAKFVLIENFYLRRTQGPTIPIYNSINIYNFQDGERVVLDYYSTLAYANYNIINGDKAGTINNDRYPAYEFQIIDGKNQKIEFLNASYRDMEGGYPPDVETELWLSKNYSSNSSDSLNVPFDFSLYEVVSGGYKLVKKNITVLSNSVGYEEDIPSTITNQRAIDIYGLYLKDYIQQNNLDIDVAEFVLIEDYDNFRWGLGSTNTSIFFDNGSEITATWQPSFSHRYDLINGVLSSSVNYPIYKFKVLKDKVTKIRYSNISYADTTDPGGSDSFAELFIRINKTWKPLNTINQDYTVFFDCTYKDDSKPSDKQDVLSAGSFSTKVRNKDVSSTSDLYPINISNFKMDIGEDYPNNIKITNKYLTDSGWSDNELISTGIKKNITTTQSTVFNITNSTYPTITYTQSGTDISPSRYYKNTDFNSDDYKTTFTGNENDGYIYPFISVTANNFKISVGQEGYINPGVVNKFDITEEYVYDINKSFLSFTKKDAITDTILTDSKLNGLSFDIINDQMNTVATVTFDSNGVPSISNDVTGNVHVLNSKIVGLTTVNGTYIVTGLSQGEYTIKEVTANVGYSIKNEIQNATLTNGIVKNITLTNYPLRSMKITKVAEDTPTVNLIGAEFAIYEVIDNQTGDIEVTPTTTLTGDKYTTPIVLKIDKTYKIFETKVPTGTQAITEPILVKTFTVPINSTVQHDVTITNVRVGDLNLHKLNAKGSSYLSGAVFSVYKYIDDNKSTYTSETPLAEITSTTAGVASLLPYDTYAVIETTAPVGYMLSNTVRKMVVNKTSQNLAIFNFKTAQEIKVLGTVLVKKHDSTNKDKTLSGADFEVFFKDDNSQWLSLGSMINEGTGYYYLEQLPIGDYKLQETHAPNGYMLNTTPIYFSIVDATVIRLEVPNTSYKAEVELTKTDTDNPNIKLKGAVFKVYIRKEAEKRSNPMYDYTEYATLTDNGDGTYSIPNLPSGEYTIMEVSPPDGYDLSEDQIDFIVENSDKIELTFANSKTKIYDLAIQKWVGDVNEINTGQDGTEDNITPSQVQVDSLIDFGIRVTNQGNSPTTMDGIVDYLGYNSGYMIFDQDSNPDWKFDDETGYSFLDWESYCNNNEADPILQAGESRVIYISLKIPTDIDIGRILENDVEIVGTKDKEGNHVVDIDSINDDDEDNNGEMVDNNIENKDDDIDSSDFAQIKVVDAIIYDLFTQKYVNAVNDIYTGQERNESDVEPTLVALNDLVSFSVLVGNQGNQPTTMSGIVDYLGFNQNDMKFIKDHNPDWEVDINTGYAYLDWDKYCENHGIDPILQEGDVYEFYIDLIIPDTALVDKILQNVVEIVDTKDADGNIVIDIDSINDNNPNNNGTMIDNETENTDGDIDSSDFAEVKITDKPVIIIPKGTIELTKIDSTDVTKKLIGAEFSIYQKQADNSYKKYGVLIPDNQGLYIVSDLPLGDYQIEETRAPEGYVLSNIRQNFSITNNSVLTTKFTNNKIVISPGGGGNGGGGGGKIDEPIIPKTPWSPIIPEKPVTPLIPKTETTTKPPKESITHVDDNKQIEPIPNEQQSELRTEPFTDEEIPKGYHQVTRQTEDGTIYYELVEDDIPQGFSQPDEPKNVPKPNPKTGNYPITNTTNNIHRITGPVGIKIKKRRGKSI